MCARAFLPPFPSCMTHHIHKQHMLGVCRCHGNVEGFPHVYGHQLMSALLGGAKSAL
jgi:hypothetical protein